MPKYSILFLFHKLQLLYFKKIKLRKKFILVERVQKNFKTLDTAMDQPVYVLEWPKIKDKIKNEPTKYKNHPKK
jgi:hypothetical protein